jgi:hypothetical protein
MRAELGVADGAPDIPMAEKILEQTRFQPFVSEHVTNVVAEHVGMHAEPDASDFSGLGNDPEPCVRGDWPPSSLANTNCSSVTSLSFRRPATSRHGGWSCLQRYMRASHRSEIIA